MTATLLLAEFLAAVSAADDEESMLRTGLELAAEAVDAEVGAIVVRGRPSMTLGYGDDIAAGRRTAGGVRRRADGTRARCWSLPALALDLEHPAHSHLVIARAGALEFTSEERGLLRAMARVLSLVIAGNRTQEAERRLNEELRERHQQLQRLVRVTSSISHGAPLAEVLDTIVGGAAECSAKRSSACDSSGPTIRAGSTWWPTAASATTSSIWCCSHPPEREPEAARSTRTASSPLTTTPPNAT